MPSPISPRISSAMPSSRRAFRRRVIFSRRSSRSMSMPIINESTAGSWRSLVGFSRLYVSISMARMARCAVSTSPRATYSKGAGESPDSAARATTDSLRAQPQDTDRCLRRVSAACHGCVCRRMLYENPADTGRGYTLFRVPQCL